MVEAVVYAIDDGAVGEDRRKALPARFDHRGLSAHVQEALVLPGKARIREIFGGRRAAHCDGYSSTALGLEGPIGVCNLAIQPGIAGGFVDELSCGCRTFGEKCDIVVIKIGQQLAQFLPSGCGERVAISRSRQRKAVGDPTALGREQRIQLAQRGCFAADLRDILQSNVLEPTDITIFHSAAPGLVPHPT